jgi:hypothetical protein
MPKMLIRQKKCPMVEPTMPIPPNSMLLDRTTPFQEKFLHWKEHMMPIPPKKK